MSLFYVDSHSILSEKRSNHTSGYWDVPQNCDAGCIWFLDIASDTAGPLPCGNEASHSWDTHRMTAIYSDNFLTGPGTRLFFHQSTWIQESVWTQSTDSWALGSTFPNSVSCSRLAVTEAGSVLRLFYVTAGPVLQEALLNITQPNATWQVGETKLNAQVTAGSC